MEPHAPIGLSDRATRELEDSGRSDLHGAVGEAISDVSASHAGRPVDEIESVLTQAVNAATGSSGVLSPETIHELADQIWRSVKHA